MISNRFATAAFGLFLAALPASGVSLAALQNPVPAAERADTIEAADTAAAAGEPADTAEAPDPLRGFERLIGTWASGGTRQTFEWGVGGLIVRARSSVASEEGERLVAEGVFLHDPLRDVVRGYFAAIEMPAAYFEYSARWEGDTLIAHLTTTEPHGDARRYVEQWRVVSPDRIAWSLRTGEDEDGPVVMTAELVRVAEPEAAPRDDANGDGGEGDDDGGEGAGNDGVGAESVAGRGAAAEGATRGGP